MANSIPSGFGVVLDSSCSTKMSVLGVLALEARSKFLVGSTIIVATLLALAYVGFTQSKTYYHTITELSTLQG